MRSRAGCGGVRFPLLAPACRAGEIAIPLQRSPPSLRSPFLADRRIRGPSIIFAPFGCHRLLHHICAALAWVAFERVAMSFASPLTEEQRDRIERNRQEALAKRARLQPQPARGTAVHAHALPVENVDAREAAAIEQALVAAAASPACPRPLPLQPHPRQQVQLPRSQQQQQHLKTPHRPPEEQRKAHEWRPDVPVENIDASEAAAIEQAMKAASQFARSSPLITSQQPASKPPSSQGPAPSANALAVTFHVIEGGMFKAMCNYHAAVIAVFKTMKTRSYDNAARTWRFQLHEHDELARSLRAIGNVTVNALPQSVLKSLRESSCSGAATAISDADAESKLQTLPPDLLAALMPFQRDGVKFAVKHGGRALIGDEMGLGKTLQGIAIAKLFEAEWPCLIIVPSALRLVWKSELERWLPDLKDSSSLSVIMKGADTSKHGRVTVISYDLLARNVESFSSSRKVQGSNAEGGNSAKDFSARDFNQYGVIIVDESHFLKNRTAKRTKTVMSIVRSAKAGT